DSSDPWMTRVSPRGCVPAFGRSFALHPLCHGRGRASGCCSAAASGLPVPAITTCLGTKGPFRVHLPALTAMYHGTGTLPAWHPSCVGPMKLKPGPGGEPMYGIRNSRATAAIAAALILLAGAGCSSMNKTQQGAVIGAGAGGVVGAVVGHAAGSTATGAIIGAAVGGAAGAIIGHQMDKQAEELQQNIPGAVVQRVGEGITVTFASGLLFDFDSDAVRGEASHNLNTLAESLEKYDNSDLLIVG